MAITGVKELVRQANEVVRVLTPQEALEAQAGGDMVLVDIRDIRELWREGKVSGAAHVPRGMLEFWFDPESPYHKQWLADGGKTYALYCASGWRSALSALTLQQMGFENIAHVDGGFNGIRDAKASIEPVERK